ncbi:MAG: hypothetical protein AAF184_02675 [Pseudomonadota bacterium]
MSLVTACRHLLIASVANIFAWSGIAHASDNVTITISPVLPDRTLARAGGEPVTSVVTMLGETVMLTITNGRDFTLAGLGGLAGTRLDEMPTDGDVVHITPEPKESEDGYVLRIQTSRWRNGQVRVFSSTVGASAGEWVRLWGRSQAPDARKVQRFSAGMREESLYVMVEP